MREKQVVVNNLLVNYYYSPAKIKTDSTVVFLHGWMANGTIWRGIMEQLNDCSVYALDLPGFGKSEMLGRGFTVQDYAEFVNEFVKKLGLRNVILVGHSFGGRIAIKLTAARKSIQKLVLVDSAGFRNDSIRKKATVVAAKVFKPFVPKLVKNKLYKMIGASDYTESGKLKETFVNVIREDLTRDMQEIRVPTLIIWGKDDKEVPAAFGERMHSLISNSKFLILKDAGHFSFLDKQEEFVKALREFCSIID